MATWVHGGQNVAAKRKALEQRKQQQHDKEEEEKESEDAGTGENTGVDETVNWNSFSWVVDDLIGGMMYPPSRGFLLE